MHCWLFCPQVKGSHFVKIKQYAAAKYPVLHTKGKVLKSALQRAVYFGQVDLVSQLDFPATSGPLHIMAIVACYQWLLS